MSAQPSAWYRLRATRAQPPGLAADDQTRVAIYRAALQQAEDLLTAATAVGPASRPLLLYYALSQAGRAIVAARGDEAEAPAYHGFSHPSLAARILQTTVEAKPQGQFPSVVRAVRSPGLSAAVELGGLMGAVPELAVLPQLGDRWLRALRVWPRPLVKAHDIMAHHGTVPVTVVFPEMPESRSAMAEALKGYPEAADVRFPNSPALPGQQVFARDTRDGRGVEVLWLDPGDGTDPLPPQYGPEGRRWLRPAVCGTDFPPNLLMTWWAILYGLSMLARYHPVEWVRALDLDSSPVAVVLEGTLDVALEVVPELVLEALEVAGA